MLRVTDVHVGYGAIRALKGVSLEINDGEVVALIGANGAGKSTLLRTISGILRPTTGDITFEERSIRGLAEDKVVRLGILQVQEGRGILTRMTVQENLEMGSYGRSDKPGVRQDMEMVFEKFPVLRDRRRQFGDVWSRPDVGNADVPRGGVRRSRQCGWSEQCQRSRRESLGRRSLCCRSPLRRLRPATGNLVALPCPPLLGWIRVR